MNFLKKISLLFVVVLSYPLQSFFIWNKTIETHAPDKRPIKVLFLLEPPMGCTDNNKNTQDAFDLCEHLKRNQHNTCLLTASGSSVMMWEYAEPAASCAPSKDLFLSIHHMNRLFVELGLVYASYTQYAATQERYYTTAKRKYYSDNTNAFFPYLNELEKFIEEEFLVVLGSYYASAKQKNALTENAVKIAEKKECNTWTVQQIEDHINMLINQCIEKTTRALHTSKQNKKWQDDCLKTIEFLNDLQSRITVLCKWLKSSQRPNGGSTVKDLILSKSVRSKAGRGNFDAPDFFQMLTESAVEYQFKRGYVLTNRVSFELDMDWHCPLIADSFCQAIENPKINTIIIAGIPYTLTPLYSFVHRYLGGTEAQLTSALEEINIASENVKPVPMTTPLNDVLTHLTAHTSRQPAASISEDEDGGAPGDGFTPSIEDVD